ncbi:nuclear hormone receptor FTZ-F1 isoform X2 [Bradysia coprophila]|uniref:nuclear hormone receptor FTZ-F1 isoform X2 n=1 Tax=Bradysia coprophila TaxID=38358 RepID=UPI00187DAA7B|nr:nuclear hormone receptor FTZ-F1 isoform X2 [Bradysia coprophila]
MNQVKPMMNSRGNSVINNCSISNDVDNNSLSVSFLTPINLLTSSNQSTQIVFTETTASISSSSRVSHHPQHVSHNSNATLNINDIVASSNNVIVQANDISVGNGTVSGVEQHSPTLMEQKDATSTSEGNILHIISTDPEQKGLEGLEDETDGYSDNPTNMNSGQQGYIPLLPPVGTVINPCDQTDLKDCIEELCPVCGDKVSGYHYGLLTCESCKGFFKRTVQNKKVYTCVAERQCHIDKTQRKRCPYCRFQKCLEVGMKLEAVRADRMRGGRNKFGPMYKRDRARKLQIMRQRQLALQTLRAAEGGNPSQLSPNGFQSYSHMNIKQEIQIPQISSLTSSSPDSSPSPIAIALGQVSASGLQTVLPLGSRTGSGGGSSSNGSTNIPSTTSSTTVQNTVTDSKLCYDTGTNPTSTADTDPIEQPLSVAQPSQKQNLPAIQWNDWKNSNSLNFPRVSPMIREFVQSVDDREWQSQLYQLLQSQSYNQCEVDLFELMCKVLDQNLFSQVDWARNTVFFKDLKVDDQMKLLQNSWSDMLVLDHLHQRIHNSLPDETTLHNGQKFDLLGLGLLGVPQLADHFNELQNKLQELKFDVGDYICMKFLLLLNPEFAEVRGITNKKTVHEGYDNVQAALLDYTLTCYPSVTDKFSKLLSIIPEIHTMAARGEEHLYLKHCAGSAPTQTLLMEMLHAKRK